MRCNSPLAVLVVAAAVVIAGWAGRSAAQGAAAGAPTNDNLVITADRATTWASPADNVNVVMLEGAGGARIELDDTKLSADRAVVWLSPVKGSLLQEQSAEIALLGNAVLDQPGQARRSGDRLFVTAVVRGVIRVTANDRAVGNAEQSETYQLARAMRPLAADATGDEIDTWMTRPAPAPATTQATTQPAERVRAPVSFSAERVETATADDGNVALVVTGNVKIFQRRPGGEGIEMQAGRAVLFTPLKSLRDLEAGNAEFTRVEEAIVAAYLEQDVRIVHSPGERRMPDQRLQANRVYYDFETDRAVLTDAVLHTVEPQKQIPVVVRAKTLRQLSMGEYRADKVKLTQSSFYTPSYAIGLKSAYIRQVDTGDPRYGTLTNFSGKGMTLEANGTPFFYWPVIGGSITERWALRNLELVSGNRYGTGLKTDWGLFELLGQLPPEDVDAELSLDYFSSRGPAVGLAGTYGGGFVTEQTKQPWAFDGRYDLYFVNDHGEDDLGRRRLDVEPEQNFRYRLVWEHQHFFPDNWQVQLSGALVSDATFQEQWFRSEWERQRPLDTAVYAKHQERTEAFTFLYSIQPQDFVTSATQVQEQTEVERVPEIGYYRIGDTIGGESGLTFFSENTIGGYRFQGSSTPLTPEADGDGGQGFRAGDTPGLPSYGQTGTPTRVTYRGDFRQEVNYPVTLAQFRFVPYVVGRYTWYSQSPDPNESSNDRLFAGAGVRLTTAFWKVDDSFVSELFDIHRLRHVIEPEVNVFTSAQTVGNERLLHYDEPIDQINDISALQVALRQRWQTKRGGAGRWRSVDFFTLNVEGNFFSNAPPDDRLAPLAFRGLYFASMPEASLPRNSINADATWRVSDTTAILSDVQYNLDEQNLASASLGLAVSREDRLSYFVGVRYIDSGDFAARRAGGAIGVRDLHSVVLSGVINYEITPKYAVSARQSFDFGEDQRVTSNYSLIRKFDRWSAAVTFRLDYIGEDSGVFVNVWPEGLGAASTASQQSQNIFR